MTFREFFASVSHLPNYNLARGIYMEKAKYLDQDMPSDLVFVDIRKATRGDWTFTITLNNSYETTDNGYTGLDFIFRREGHEDLGIES